MPQLAQSASLLNLLPLVFIFVIFYFLLIRPQKTKEKQHQKLLAGLTKNDNIVTTGGIHGTIVNVKDKTITLRVDENVKMEVDKNCVAYVQKAQSPG